MLQRKYWIPLWVAKEGLGSKAVQKITRKTAGKIK